MNWKIFFLKFLRNLVLGVIMGVVLLGIFGYVLGGKEGLINMVFWGVALGLIGGFSSGLGMIFEAGFWGKGQNIGMFPEWNWFVKEPKDEKKNY